MSTDPLEEKTFDAGLLFPSLADQPQATAMDEALRAKIDDRRSVQEAYHQRLFPTPQPTAEELIAMELDDIRRRMG